MLEYLPIVWVAIIVLSVVCEAATRTFIPLWFAPAAAVSFIMSFANVPKWLEVLVFFLCTIIFLVLSRTVFAYLLGIKKRRKIRVSERQALVIETVDNLRNSGKVLFCGLEVPAVSCYDYCVIPVGEIVTVLGEKNGAVICR